MSHYLDCTSWNINEHHDVYTSTHDKLWLFGTISREQSSIDNTNICQDTMALSELNLYVLICDKPMF